MSKLTYLLYACPGCQGAIAAASSMFEVQMLDAQCWVRQCSSCDLIFKDRFPTEVGLKQLYPESYPHFESSGPDVATENAWRQKLMRAKSHHQQNGSHTSLRLLDVGCGAGGFVDFAQREGYQATGVDPHLPESRRSERMLRGQPEDLAPQQFDIVSMLNVAEHLTDPLASFANVRGILAPRGTLLVTCPYGDSLARRMYKNEWSHLALEEHLLFWTPSSMLKALRKCGFSGRFNYRIGGTPFPAGRVARGEANRQATSDSVPSAQVPSQPARNPPTPSTAKRFSAFALLRAVQKRPAVALIARQAIHQMRLGDYMEFVISVD